jgi:recombination endonuclease VII
MASTEKQKAASRKWAANNREKVRATWRKWYTANAEKRSAYQRLANAAHPERHRKRHEQPEPTRPKPATCECCWKAPRKNGMHLDHCHLTGEFRGWLCGPCNQGIGLLGDNEAGLIQAIFYLRSRL